MNALSLSCSRDLSNITFGSPPYPINSITCIRPWTLLYIDRTSWWRWIQTCNLQWEWFMISPPIGIQQQKWTFLLPNFISGNSRAFGCDMASDPSDSLSVEKCHVSRTRLRCEWAILNMSQGNVTHNSCGSYRGRTTGTEILYQEFSVELAQQFWYW